jgi:predicted methyltransferase
MKEFTSAALRSLRVEIDAALAGVCKKNGISLHLGNISYSSDSFHGKLEGVIQTKDASGLTMVQIKQKKALEDYGSMYGLKASDYGKRFTFAGSTYKLVGLKPNSPKYPIIGEAVSNGKSYKFPENATSKLF